MKDDFEPLISIITVVYNASATIENTISSVVNHKYNNIEYIIIDGGSTDGTIDIIKKYNDKVSFWVSEPDNGIYDAMNKGVSYANGKWILNINAGDVLLNLPIKLLISPNYKDFGAICGSVLLDNKDILKAKYNWVLKIRNTLPHQALFYNKELLYSAYNLDYKVYADYAYNLGMLKRNQKVYIIDMIISNHSTDGISQNKYTAAELFKVIKNEIGSFYFFVSFMHFKINGVSYRFKKAFHV